MKKGLTAVLRKIGLLDRYLHYKQAPYIAQNNQTAQFWAERIQAYLEGEVTQPEFSILQPELVGQKIIWQYWGQGFDTELPELVRYCFDSVDRYKGDYTVIRLTSATIQDYVQLPKFVEDRLSQGDGYTWAIFSDLLRVALLAIYGGAWLDATIYLTGALPDYSLQGDFFMYQRSELEPHRVQQYFRSSYYAYWGWDKSFKVRCLNSYIVAKPNNTMLRTLYTLLLSYWETESEVNDYFFFQVLFNEVLRTSLAVNCPIVSDCIPHLLAVSLCRENAYISTTEALQTTTLHKLNSKGEDLQNFLAFLQSR